MPDLSKITELDSTDSTNELAFRELAAGRAGHLDAWIAQQQTAGRGRRGSTWLGQPGDSLMMSVLLCGTHAGSLPGPSLLSMSVGLALIDGIGSDEVRLDWPNDLVTSRADLQRSGSAEAPKLAGILIEARNFDPARPTFVVGVGVNVAGELPAELLAERPACTLAQLGLQTTPLELGTRFRAALALRLKASAHDPEATCRSYLEATGLADRKVEVITATDSCTGQLTGITPGGVMLLSEGHMLTTPLEHVQAIRPARLY